MRNHFAAKMHTVITITATVKLGSENLLQLQPQRSTHEEECGYKRKVCVII